MKRLILVILFILVLSGFAYAADTTVSGGVPGSGLVFYCPGHEPTDGQFPQWVAASYCYQGASTTGFQTTALTQYYVWQGNGSNVAAATNQLNISTFCDGSDTTKCEQDVYSGISHATTRTRTWPDADVTFPASGILVGTTDTQTLSGKTLTNPSLGTSYLSTTKTAGTGGTTQYKLVKIDTDGTVIIASTSDVGILGVAASTITVGNPVEVATRGVINCVADNATTIGHIAIVGTSTAGTCRDSGQTASTSIDIGTQIIGKFISAVSGGANASLQLYGPGHFGAKVINLPSIGGVFDGGGSPIALNLTIYRYIPVSTTISQWTILCDQNVTTSGIVIDVWKIAYTTDTLPTVSNTLCGSGTKPNVASGSHKTGQASWDCGTTTVTAGDVVAFSVTTAPTSATWCAIDLKFQ